MSGTCKCSRLVESNSVRHGSAKSCRFVHWSGEKHTCQYRCQCKIHVIALEIHTTYIQHTDKVCYNGGQKMQQTGVRWGSETSLRVCLIILILRGFFWDTTRPMGLFKGAHISQQRHHSLCKRHNALLPCQVTQFFLPLLHCSVKKNTVFNFRISQVFMKFWHQLHPKIPICR